MWTNGEQSQCDLHGCWRAAPGGYCVAPRCYCGGCPWYRPIDPAASQRAADLLETLTERRRRRGRDRAARARLLRVVPGSSNGSTSGAISTPAATAPDGNPGNDADG